MSDTAKVRPLLFFILTFIVSWSCWIALAIWGVPALQLPGLILMAVGGLGPAVAALSLLATDSNRAQRRAYWRRVYDLRRIPTKWYVVIFLLYPLLHFVAVGFSSLAYGESASFENISRFAQNPLSIFPYLLFLLVFGPLPEELGWRGYALDGLLSRFPAWSASLLLGVVWAAWHIPLFFIAGTYQAQIGFWGLEFWKFVLEILADSILLTWVFNNTNRSTLSAILFHFMINLSGELFEYGTRTDNLHTFLVLLCATAVVAVWGPRKLVRTGDIRQRG
ncbi:MAG: type II CAAX endopeptidase family protein [Anaerolineales bacterium]|jgi:membrane protease YdiL (CAAX protease family)